jgi:Flp pilus assembly protein TadG
MSFVKRLSHDTRAASAAEFALVLPIMLMFMIGTIDVGRLMWTWNRAEKATQVGARVAIVTTMVPATLAAQNFALSNGIPGGDPVPAGQFSTTECDDTSCTNGWGYDPAAFTEIVRRMQVIMPEIAPENVTITYDNVGLGYAGDPFGPDVAPLVTVRLQDISFQPLSLYIFGATIPLSNVSAALTAEDSSGTYSN